MIGFVFYIIAFCTIVFLSRSIIVLYSVNRKDATMFAMAELRREILTYLRQKHRKISQRDAKTALYLLDNCSWIISNHENFYGEFTDFKDIKAALTSSKSEVEEVDSLIDNIKNKTIKGFYIKFGLILLKNISKHIKLFRFKAIFFIMGILARFFWENNFKLLRGYFRWYDDTNSHFNKYGDKHNLSF